MTGLSKWAKAGGKAPKNQAAADRKSFGESYRNRVDVSPGRGRVNAASGVRPNTPGEQKFFEGKTGRARDEAQAASVKANASGLLKDHVEASEAHEEAARSFGRAQDQAGKDQHTKLAAEHVAKAGGAAAVRSFVGDRFQKSLAAKADANTTDARDRKRIADKASGDATMAGVKATASGTPADHYKASEAHQYASTRAKMNGDSKSAAWHDKQAKDHSAAGDSAQRAKEAGAPAGPKKQEMGYGGDGGDRLRDEHGRFASK